MQHEPGFCMCSIPAADAAGYCFAAATHLEVLLLLLPQGADCARGCVNQSLCVAPRHACCISNTLQTYVSARTVVQSHTHSTWHLRGIYDSLQQLWSCCYVCLLCKCSFCCSAAAPAAAAPAAAVLCNLLGYQIPSACPKPRYLHVHCTVPVML